MKLVQALIIILITGTVYSQQKSETIVKAIADEACKCISTIDSNQEHKNKAIKNCVANAIVKELNTDVSINENNTSEIQVDIEAYKKVEAYLVEHCKALNQVAFTENTNFKHATSKNVLAQLAYDDGMEYMEEQNYEGAIEKFSKAINIDPKFAFAWDNLGVSYRKTNQYQKAIEAYKKSLEINPQGRMPLMNIALAYNLKKEYKEAIKYYRKFIDIYPEDPEGYYGIGLILYTNGKQKEGLDNLIHAYTIYTKLNSPYRADAAKKIGFMYNDLKNEGKLDMFQEVAQKYNLKIDSK